VRQLSRLIVQVFAAASHLGKGRLLHFIKLNANIVYEQNSHTCNPHAYNNKKRSAHDRVVLIPNLQVKNHIVCKHTAARSCVRCQDVRLCCCWVPVGLIARFLVTTVDRYSLYWPITSTTMRRKLCRKYFWDPYGRPYLNLVVHNVTLRL